MEPVLQLALDFVDIDRALKLAREGAEGGAEWLEAGTPLIKSEGLNAIRRLREAFPRHTIVADLKTMDAGRAEMEMAAKAGAGVALAMGVAADGTVRECIDAGRNYGIRVGFDLLRVPDPVRRAEQLKEWGADFVIVHCGIDQQMAGETPFEILKKISSATDLTLAVAGGLNSETAPEAIDAGARILIVGGAITKAADARAATRQIVEAMRTRKAVHTDLYKRTGADQIRDALLKVSTANISDGAHRLPCCHGIRPVVSGLKLAGPAVTVRTYPGDWSKPVQAIDIAQPGEVIVIDAGGMGPAVWGELATHSCLQRKLGGVVIEGAIRDSTEIRATGFPAFSRLVMSNAGEPKGLGEINIPIMVGGIAVRPGDWIVGDDDGVMVLPRERAVEMANYALDCLERENRIRGEIKSGQTTLGKVVELLKWERKS